MHHKSRLTFEEVYAGVLERLVQGQHRPSHRIGIVELSHALHVSTTPVREALRQLAGRDIVVDHHREGFYLTPLNARTIAGLYSAHQSCVEQAINSVAQAHPSWRRVRNLWRLFDDVTLHTKDTALIGLRRYLADRLSMVRRFETRTIGDMPTRGSMLAAALAKQDLASAHMLSLAFHQTCMARAGEFALLFNPEV